MLLHQPASREGHPNDPILINPRGAEVQVPENMVPELLKKGFKIKDRSWTPVIPEPEVIIRSVPKELVELEKELKQKLDILEVTEI